MRGVSLETQKCPRILSIDNVGSWTLGAGGRPGKVPGDWVTFPRGTRDSEDKNMPSLRFASERTAHNQPPSGSVPLPSGVRRTRRGGAAREAGAGSCVDEQLPGPMNVAAAALPPRRAPSRGCRRPPGPSLHCAAQSRRSLGPPGPHLSVACGVGASSRPECSACFLANPEEPARTAEAAGLWPRVGPRGNWTRRVYGTRGRGVGGSVSERKRVPRGSPGRFAPGPRVGSPGAQGSGSRCGGVARVLVRSPGIAFGSLC